MSELTESIRSKGFWRIDVRPTDYVETRIPNAALKPILDRAVVRLRGWDFPHLDRQGRVSRGNHWLGGETDWSYYRESWRFYQSGQFVYLIGMHEDWVESFEGLALPRFPVGFKGIGVGDALFRITETYEFAARLAVSEAGGEQMRIGIELRNVARRRLYVDDPMRMPMDNDYSFDEPSLTLSATVSRADLAGRSRQLALDATLDFFGRFGWHPLRELIQGQQDQLRW